MKFRGRLNNTWLALPLAATVAITACAPQSTQQANRTADVPAVVEQVQQAKMLPVGTFAGMVATYENGDFRPVVGAIVKVDGGEGQAVTDADGRYVFNGLKPGDYKVAVTKDGFAAGEAAVTLSPVTGTPRVNVAMNMSSYGLKQIAAFPATITGVVTDPRGAALPSATVRVATTAGTGTNQIVPANPNGFYTVTIPNMTVSPISPGWVQVTAFGTTPGGVKVEVDEIWAKPITSASLVVNARCDAFTRPQNMTHPSGTFTPMGSTTAAIDVEWMSTRADEFYLRLTYDDGILPAGDTSFAVLPESVTNTPAVGAVPQKCNIKYRVPFTFPSNVSTYTVEIIPFGQTSAKVTSGTSLVVQYTEQNFSDDMEYAADDTLVDDSPGTGSVNNGLTLVAGENAKYTLKVRNDNATISPDLRVKGIATAGATIVSATVTTKDSNPAVPVTTTVNATIVGPDASTGAWSITGFTIPKAVPLGAQGEADVDIVFSTPPTLAPGTSFTVSGIEVEMPSAALKDTSTTDVTTTPSQTLAIKGINRSELKFNAAKSIVAGANANDGMSLVHLEVDLGNTGSSAFGAIKIVDETLTNQLVPASKAVLKGNKLLPLAGAPLGLTTADVLGITVDANAEVQITPSDNTWTLETLCTVINIAVPGVTASREAGTNFLKIERNVAGSTPTVKVGPSTAATTLAALGLSSGQVATAGANGMLARYLDDGVGANLQPTVTSVGGTTTWQFAAGGTSSHVAGGKVTATFTVIPTAPVVPVLSTAYNDEIIIEYVLEPTSGPGVAGVTAGNGLAAMGPKIVGINHIFPFTTLNRDVAVTSVNGLTKLDDAAGATPI